MAKKTTRVRRANKNAGKGKGVMGSLSKAVADAKKTHDQMKHAKTAKAHAAAQKRSRTKKRDT